MLAEVMTAGVRAPGIISVTRQRPAVMTRNGNQAIVNRISLSQRRQNGGPGVFPRPRRSAFVRRIQWYVSVTSLNPRLAHSHVSE